MGRITDRVTTYATAAELRRHIGRPLLPCSACSSPILAVLQSGELSCPDCHQELWDVDLHRSCPAVALLLAVGADGLAVELDKGTLEPVRPRDGLGSQNSLAMPGETIAVDPAMAEAEAALLALRIVDGVADGDGRLLWIRPGTDRLRRTEIEKILKMA